MVASKITTQELQIRGFPAQADTRTYINTNKILVPPNTPTTVFSVTIPEAPQKTSFYCQGRLRMEDTTAQSVATALWTFISDNGSFSAQNFLHYPQSIGYMRNPSWTFVQSPNNSTQYNVKLTHQGTTTGNPINFSDSWTVQLSGPLNITYYN